MLWVDLLTAIKTSAWAGVPNRGAARRLAQAAAKTKNDA
jgi:hypothetical protein